jgi:CRP-like cAMP-binding protein
VLISKGANERSVYFIENGSLSVHYESESTPGRLRMAVVMAGSAVGEGGFFSHRPRNATVQAASPCRVWVLTPIRFGELTNRQPPIALALTLGLGALMSRRMLDRRMRIAVT